MQGTVEFFRPDFGYGFIRSDGGGHDIFVNVMALKRAGLCSLPAGQRVTFNIVPRKDGRPRSRQS